MLWRLLFCQVVIVVLGFACVLANFDFFFRLLFLLGVANFCVIAVSGTRLSGFDLHEYSLWKGRKQRKQQP
jgi:hypothetical protein